MEAEVARMKALTINTGNNMLSGEAWTAATSGYGPIERNMSNGESGARDGRMMAVNGKRYDSGFGVHANSSMTFNLGGKCKRFISDVGIDDEVGNQGSVVFQVFADGVKVFDSGRMTGADAAKTVNVDVSGRRKLKLVVGDAGDNNYYDHADWAGAVLTDCEISGTPTPPAPTPPAPTPPAPTPPAPTPPAPTPPAPNPVVGTGNFKLPPAGKVAWDWQIGASTDSAIKVAADVKLIDLDGFTVSAAKVAELKRQGLYTVCYIDAGSYEPGRPDSARYPDYLKIQQDPDWPAEYFLDVTDVFKPNSVLASILIDRMKMCKSKGFDALEPDNLQNDENVRGGRITTQQQIDFNGWIADQAHGQGLAVFQKNGPDKILLRDRTGKMMVDKFDGILNEECQQFGECGPLAEYVKRGKLALNVEYSRNKALDCNLMAQLGVNALKKDLSLVGSTMGSYLRETCN
ncbi:ring canal kelch-like protein [Deinococcus marmoris]|uniref:Ring canal kelch-like protein n=2 Tax=Deinococcus marmoris TaxID=249408 RepID=A0A1U7NZ92_9DEIO|nr:ring canal kelch-like protein [Deinococcus marmoris]